MDGAMSDGDTVGINIKVLVRPVTPIGIGVDIREISQHVNESIAPVQHHTSVVVLNNTDTRMHVMLVIHVFGGADFRTALKALVAHPYPIFGDHIWAEIRAAPEDIVNRQFSKTDNYVRIRTCAPQP